MERQKLVGSYTPFTDFNLQVISLNHLNKSLWLYGVNPEGLSVALRVVDFKPIFYIRVKLSQHPDLEATIDDLEQSFNDLAHKENIVPVVHSIEVVKSVRAI